MNQKISLGQCLNETDPRTDPTNAIRPVLAGIASSAVQISELIASPWTQGDTDLEQLACDAMQLAIVKSQDAEVTRCDAGLLFVLRQPAPLAVTVTPLLGAENVTSGLPASTLFSIYPLGEGARGVDSSELLLCGRKQRAAGMFVYGVQTTLFVSLGAGTHRFVLDRDQLEFQGEPGALHIPTGGRDLYVDTSRRKSWDDSLRHYFAERTENRARSSFTVRWSGSLAADLVRLFTTGGVYLAPRIPAQTETTGLNLVFQANPIARLVEAAGGASSNGRCPVLDLDSRGMDQRIRCFFGEQDEVAAIEALYAHPEAVSFQSPLYRDRGLFRH